MAQAERCGVVYARKENVEVGRIVLFCALHAPRAWRILLHEKVQPETRLVWLTVPPGAECEFCSIDKIVRKDTIEETESQAG